MVTMSRLEITKRLGQIIKLSDQIMESLSEMDLEAFEHQSQKRQFTYHLLQEIGLSAFAIVSSGKLTEEVDLELAVLANFRYVVPETKTNESNEEAWNILTTQLPKWAEPIRRSTYLNQLNT